jgi:Rieske Fe-S protein
VVDAKSILRLIAVSTATVAAGAVGGPVAAAEVAAFMASPPGRKLTDSVIEQTAENRGVVLEDLARGGFVTQPTLGLTGEAGPEFVFPLTQMPKPKRKRSRSARAADKKLSKAFKEANRRYRKKDGSLRAGRTQADIARLAQRLRKKM